MGGERRFDQRVAYLVNQYPKVSHTFIRREILALEALGLEVRRFSLRAGEACDPADAGEEARTEVVLRAGPGRLLAAAAAVLAGAPRRGFRALRLAVACGRRSHRGVARHLAYLAEAAWLSRRLRQTGIGHLHAHFGTNPAAVAMLCRELGGPPFSFTIHGPEEWDGPEALSLPEKLRRCRFAVTVSHFGRGQAMRWAEAELWPRLHVVRCAVDESFLGAPLTPVPAAPRLVCVGRLCEQKGQLLLVEAFLAATSPGDGARLMLVGDGPFRERIEGRLRELGGAGRVEITGWAAADRVQKELLAARALVLPSLAEGLPVVIMEALALGRPVVSTYVAGIPELVRPGVNGWLVPAGSLGDLVAALKAVLAAAPEELGRLGAAGREAVARQHHAGTEAARLAELFGGEEA